MQKSRPLATLLALSVAAVFAAQAPAAIETWSNLDGQKMQAEFLGKKGDYVSFKKEDGTRYLYPYAKLSEADRARVDAHSASGIVLPPDEPVAATTPAAPEAKVGALAKALNTDLVSVKGKSLAPVPAGKLDGAKYVAVYYSAKWCPPCRAFTPELVKAYKKIKARHPDFELIFVSSDRTAEAMADYMIEYDMAWPALGFDKKRSAASLRRPGHERGIPNLVFMDADGKDISVSYTPAGEYRGPGAVLKDIEKHFKM